MLFCLLNGLNVELYLYLADLQFTFDLVRSFFFGLCGKHLLDFCCVIGNESDGKSWLANLTGEYEEELIAESQLNLSDLASALTPLVPPGLSFRGSSSYLFNLRSMLFKETVTHALRTNMLKRLVFKNKCVINGWNRNSEGKLIWPIDITRKSDHDHDNAMKERWSELITDQNLEFQIESDLESDQQESDLKTECENKAVESTLQQCVSKSVGNNCLFTLTICDANLDQQLNWLSNFVSIEGILINKPIHEIKCKIPTKTLCKITELIRHENVESVEIQCNADCILPPEPWNEFLHHAKQSKQLLDMEITGRQKETLFVDLSDLEGKKWRRIELLGNVLPCIGRRFDSSDDCLPKWDLENVVKNIPGYIEYLRVHLTKDQYIFTQDSTLPMVRHLRELFIRVRDLQHLKQVWNWSDLGNLQFLAIDFPDFNLDDHMHSITSDLVSMISHCHHRLVLKIAENCSGEFVHHFLLNLSDEKWGETENKLQKTAPRLDTLLIPYHKQGEGALPDRTIKVIKQLLLSGRVKHLWVRGWELKDEFLKSVCGVEFEALTNSFNREEGFDYKAINPSEVETRWKLNMLLRDNYVEINRLKEIINH